MFDELDNNQAKTPPSPLNNQNASPAAPTPPSAPDDIFSETEKPAKPAILQPKTEIEQSGQYQPGITPQKNAKKITVWFVLVAVLALVCLIGFAAYYFLAAQPKGQPALIEENGAIAEENNDDIPAVEDNTADIPPEKTAAEADADQDGLTDAEEEELGTNPGEVDTDSDGLFDREEARVYKTDPLNPDTDGDGYLDGEEVAGGYNPLGEGRLYEIE